MSEQPNPYAPPRLESDFQPSYGGVVGSIRREGHLVVIRRTARCFRHAA